MLHYVIEEAFDELLRCWRHHHQTRTTDAPLQRQAQARIALDTARDRVHRFRVALHPNDVEAASVAHTVFCPSLDAIVHLRWLDRSPMRPGNFDCPCGELVPIPKGLREPIDVLAGERDTFLN